MYLEERYIERGGAFYLRRENLRTIVSPPPLPQIKDLFIVLNVSRDHDHGFRPIRCFRRRKK